MELALVLNVHNNPELVLDSVDAISTYATNNILLLVEKSGWKHFQDVPLKKVEGFAHKAPKSPYRNMALALKMVTETWPNSDWYCYCESDVLFASSRFKFDLEKAEEHGVWMLGNDGRVDTTVMPLIESLMGSSFKSSYYLLGCCLFFHKNFINKLKEIDFLDRFLNLTNGFDGGDFPLYKGYDISEHMYSTICRHLGGKIGVFAHYDEYGKWHGSYQYFPVRWKPELDIEKDNFPQASVLHPLKNLQNPIRVLHRQKRQQCLPMKIK